MGAISSKLPANTDAQAEAQKALGVIIDGFVHVQAADSGRSGALIPFEVGQRSARMWGKIPLGSGALFQL